MTKSNDNRSNSNSETDFFKLYENNVRSIPRIDSKKELELAAKMNSLKQQYRKALLSNESILEKLEKLFLEAENNPKTAEELFFTGNQKKEWMESNRSLLREICALLKKYRNKIRKGLKKIENAETDSSEFKKGALAIRIAAAEADSLLEDLPIRFELLEKLGRELTAQAKKADQNSVSGEMLVLMAKKLSKISEDFYLVRNQLVESHLYLVLLLVKSYRNMEIEEKDLIQDGNKGLLLAVDRFDHTRGFRFGTYAGTWIHQTIQRALTYQAHLIQIPFISRQRQVLIKKAASEFRNLYGTDPSLKEIAKEVKLSEKEIDRILKIPSTPTSLDTTLNEDTEETPCNFVVDTKELDPQEAAALSERDDMIAKCLSTVLNDQEQVVIRKLLGFDGEPMTQSELGNELNLTRDQVRRIHDKAISKIRNSKYGRMLAAF